MVIALGSAIIVSATGACAAETEDLVNSQEKSFTQEPDGTGSSILAKNKVKGRLDVHSPPLMRTYAVAKSSANRLQGYIYAQAKTYNGDVL
ncbi:hypothetical protein AB4X15_07820 [Peribacillus simplex]|uniref:hypothetical protein n=1 Tax=Peribacillus TaxID=2675229 RepID=UPI0017860980|nr:hypothetical protein [Brevibacillus sp. JNUCC-41]QOS88689.1 hypothetical protein JNUCC41_17930 [Brevibacillus sp. JNUCC-41]